MRKSKFLSCIKLRRFLSGKGLGRIPGASAIDSLMYHTLIRPLGIVPIDVQGNTMYVDSYDRDIGRKLLANSFREEEYETELFKNVVKDGMVVVDIGANLGYYTLMAARLVGQSGIVYAFEPVPSNYELLRKNIEVNGYTNVVPIQKAVSFKCGKAQFWFEKDWSGSPGFSKYAVLRVSKHKSLEKGGFVEVETVSLDEFFEDTIKNHFTKVDVIKVDTAGGEGLITQGAEGILKSNPKIFLEFWPDALKDLGIDPLQLLYKLRDYGFTIKCINERKKALEPIDEERAKAGDGLNLLLEK